MPKTPKSAKLRVVLDTSKILRQEDGKLYLGGREVPEGMVKTLQSDAHLYAQTTLWPLLLETTRKYFLDLGINESTCWEHVLVAKAALTVMDWEEGWLRTIAKAK